MDKRDGMIGVVALLVGGLGIKLIKERRYRNYLVNKFGDRNAESFSAEECNHCGNVMATSPCCGISHCPVQDFDCACEKHYGSNYPDLDEETGERYGNWEWSGDYWYQPKNAESFSADSISICGICSVAGHRHCGQTTGCPCCEIRVKKYQNRPICRDCLEPKTHTPQEYEQWTCWPCRDAAGGHGNNCYCYQCMAETDESFSAESKRCSYCKTENLEDFAKGWDDYCMKCAKRHSKEYGAESFSAESMCKYCKINDPENCMYFGPTCLDKDIEAYSEDYEEWIKENFESIGDNNYVCNMCKKYGGFREIVDKKDLHTHMDEDIEAYSDDKPEHMTTDDLNELYSSAFHPDDTTDDRYYFQAESFEAGTWTVDGEVHEIPDFLDPDYCRVIGSGKYRFNQYDRHRKAWRQYRFKTKDEAMEYLSGWTLPLGMVNPSQDQYDFPPKQAESFHRRGNWEGKLDDEPVYCPNCMWDGLESDLVQRGGQYSSWVCPDCSHRDWEHRVWENVMNSAESHAYSYAYNEGHSDSRKREEYRPNLTSARQEGDFKKILKQKGD